MKIAILNDTHCGIRNSAEIFLDNAGKFYSEVFFPYLIENDIKQIIHLGDYYDNRKHINFKALHQNRKVFLSRLRELGICMDIIPGNHDCYYKNTNDLNALKELQGHYMNEVHIVMEPTVMEYGSTKIGMLPWINGENYDKSMEFVQTCKADILCAHLELNGFEMMRGLKAHDGMDASPFKRFEMVLSGHYHTKSSQYNIHYLGTQMEFTWADAHDRKYFHVLDTDTRELTAIHNPHTLFYKILYDDEKCKDYARMDVSCLDEKFVKIVVINKKDLFTFDRFVDRIQQRPIHELKISESYDEFMGSSVSDDGLRVEDTTELLDSYVDGVKTDLDKDRIKKEMRNFLTEAQTLEIV